MSYTVSRIEDLLRNKLTYSTYPQKELEKCNALISQKISDGTAGRDTFERSPQISEYPVYDEVTIQHERIGFSDAGPFSNMILKDITKYLKDYFAGKVSEEDVKAYFEGCFRAMRDYTVNNGLVNAYDKEADQEIIAHVYELLCKGNQLAALQANREEGQEINNKYQNGARLDFIYYNSDYYYKWESTKKMVLDMADKVAADWNVPAIDADEIEKNTVFVIDGGLDFNKGWNCLARDHTNRGNMIDEGLAPPRDFKLFYKQEPYYKDKDEGRRNTGILIFRFGGYEAIKEMPFELSRRGIGEKQIFNASELLRLTGKDTELYEEYNAYFRNFNLYTRLYDFQYFQHVMYDGYKINPPYPL